MGEETITKIFNAGFNTISNMLNISFDVLMYIEGFGEATSNIVLQNNKKIMAGVELPLLMQASDCFKGIGAIKARKLLDEMTDQERTSFYDGTFLSIQPAISSMQFKQLPITMQNLILGYTSFIQFLNQTQIPVIKPKTKVITEGKCTSMSVCVSGFRDHDFENRVINAGGKIINGVSKNTTHLVVKDKSAVTSKIIKAQSIGIKILDVEEFNALYLC